jgi:uncharacterized repeat protein (TIGR04138 family)
MQGKDFRAMVEAICERDARFKADSYEFVMQALGYTQKKLKRSGHVSGKELLDGIRQFALETYGPMARTVLDYWGIKKTGDFGTIVFNMIEGKILSKTDSDSLIDFENVYDFENAFKPVVKDFVIE